MQKILIVVDMQVDFVNGSLGTAEAQTIVPAAVEKVRGHEGPVIFTRDTHGPDYLDTQEGKKLPVEHCIEGTGGWQIIPELRQYAVDVVNKGTFGSTALAERLRAQAEGIESIEVIGLCTDICVVSNAMLLKAAFPEADLAVCRSCCAGVTPARHEAALETMASCQIDVI